MHSRKMIILVISVLTVLLCGACSPKEMTPYDYLRAVQGEKKLLLAEDGTVWINEGGRGIGRLSTNPVQKEILARQWKPESVAENEMQADDLTVELLGFEGALLKFNISNASEQTNKYISTWISVQLEDEWYAVEGTGEYELNIQLEAGETGEYEISFSCSPAGSGYLPSGRYRLNIRDGTKYIRYEFDAELDNLMQFSGEAYSLAVVE